MGVQCYSSTSSSSSLPSRSRDQGRVESEYYYLIVIDIALRFFFFNAFSHDLGCFALISFVRELLRQFVIDDYLDSFQTAFELGQTLAFHSQPGPGIEDLLQNFNFLLLISSSGRSEEHTSELQSHVNL